MVHAFVLIDAEPARIAQLAEELADVVTRRVTALDGIVNTRTLIAFQAFSRHDLEALWDLGGEGA